MAGSSGNKTNSAFNWVEVEVEAELGKKDIKYDIPSLIEYFSG